MTETKPTPYLDGWHAHKNGHLAEDNPYAETRQARSYHQWISGWCDRFQAVKHGYALTWDHELFSD